MHVIVPDGSVNVQVKQCQRRWEEKVYDYVIACNSLKGNISEMKVVEG